MWSEARKGTGPRGLKEPGSSQDKKEAFGSCRRTCLKGPRRARWGLGLRTPALAIGLPKARGRQWVCMVSGAGVWARVVL